MALNPRQKRFVEEYLVDLNSTQAALRAGYSERSARQIASRLLTKDDVQAYLSELKRQRSERTQINADWVLKQAAELHRRCMQQEAVLNENGEPTGEYKFEHVGAARALEIIGKHVDVQAFNERKTVEVLDRTEILDRARDRAELRATTH